MEPLPRRLGQSAKPAGVRGRWGRRGLHFHADDPATVVLKDKVDLASDASAVVQQPNWDVAPGRLGVVLVAVPDGTGGTPILGDER